MRKSVSTTILLVLLGCWMYLDVAAQPMQGGARAGALGQATTALAADAWSHANPAGRAAVDRRAISLVASEGFGLAELRLSALALVFPTPIGTFAGGAQSFGYDAYRENRVRAGFARRFAIGPSRHLLVGLDVVYYQNRIEEYGSASAVGLTVGWLAPVIPGLHAGFCMSNVNAPSLAEGEELERSIAIGFMYHPIPRMRVLIDAIKDVRFPLSFRAGLEVQPVSLLFLRAGVATEPVRFSTGVGVHLGVLNADVAAERHELLGWTPGVSVSVGW
jgi:hypothetical protein